MHMSNARHGRDASIPGRCRSMRFGSRGPRSGSGQDIDFGDGLGGSGGGRFGGRRSGKRFSGEQLRLIVLALLEDGPQHGYQLIRKFAEMSAEAYSPSPGVLYPLLSLMQDTGLIGEEPSEGRSRSFALTETGKDELIANREAADAALSQLTVMGDDRQRVDASAIKRAMMNLRTATIHRMRAEDADKETAFAISALLDEVTQKIERL